MWNVGNKMSIQKPVKDISEREAYCENVLKFTESICDYCSIKLYPWQKDLLKKYLLEKLESE